MRVVRNTVAAVAIVPWRCQPPRRPTPSHQAWIAQPPRSSTESTPGTTLYEVVVNGVSAVKDSFVVPSSPTSGTLTAPYPVPTGPFAVCVNANFSTGETGTVTKSMTCAAPPARTPPASAPPAPPVAPPPAQPPCERGSR